MDNEIYFKILKISKDTVDFFNYLISNYGEVKLIRYGINDRYSKRNTYHDFIYYCLTKSCRSLYASIELAENNFREDSLIILRTVYENYLHISHVLKNPEKIQEYVVQTIGLSAGKYKYKTDEFGKKNYKIIIDNNTKKEYRHGTSNYTRAKFGISNIDINMHQYLYNYLSEYIHPNMMGSGDYRSKDSSHYSTEPWSIHIEVPVLILYICFILTDAMNYYHTQHSEWNVEDLSVLEIIEFISIRGELKNQLLEVLEVIDADKNVKNLIISRLEDVD